MRRLIFLLLLVGLGSVPIAGQDDPSASVDQSRGALSVDLAPVLDDPGLRRAIHSGLPLRIEIRAELWRDGFFDSQEGSESWRASVIHDPVRRSYEVEVVGSPPRSVSTLSDAGRILEDGFAIGLRPTRDARYYYLAVLEVQTLSLSDLEELRRWLRGDVAPAVGGERGGESAVANGVRRMVVRALGLPTVRRRLRTDTFRWTPEAGGG